MKFDFFIAHASPDKSAAEDLCWHLQDLDRTVFLDQADIEAGRAWDAELADALEQIPTDFTHSLRA
jgi:TIR domain-containing protein